MRAAGKERADGRLDLARGGQCADLLVVLVDHEHAAVFDRSSIAGSARGRLPDELSRHRIGAARPFQGADAGVRAVVGMGRYQGMDLDILGPDEIRSRYPFVETHDLDGALYDPNDGDIDPAQLTQALAKGARDMGATILRFCPATGARRENGEWVISTPQGRNPLRIRRQRRRILCRAKSANGSAATCR